MLAPSTLFNLLKQKQCAKSCSRHNPCGAFALNTAGRTGGSKCTPLKGKHEPCLRTSAGKQGLFLVGLPAQCAQCACNSPVGTADAAQHSLCYCLQPKDTRSWLFMPIMTGLIFMPASSGRHADSHCWTDHKAL